MNSRMPPPTVSGTNTRSLAACRTCGAGRALAGRNSEGLAAWALAQLAVLVAANQYATTLPLCSHDTGTTQHRVR